METFVVSCQKKKFWQQLCHVPYDVADLKGAYEAFWVDGPGWPCICEWTVHNGLMGGGSAEVPPHLMH